MKIRTMDMKENNEENYLYKGTVQLKQNGVENCLNLSVISN